MLMSARVGSSSTKNSLSPLVQLDKSFTPTATPRKPFPMSRISKDENRNRKDKVNKFLDQINAQLDVLKRNDKSMLDLRGRIKESSQALYGIVESIFALYNVSIQIIFQDQTDSAMKIEPLIHPSKAVQTLNCIALVLSRFPYSLIKGIDLNKFTICKAVYLKKDGYEALCNSRVMSNAIFSTHEHNSFNKIEKHFYKIVLYHLEKKMPSLHADWPVERPVKLGPLLDMKKSSLPQLTHLPSFDKSYGSLNSIRSPSPMEKFEKQNSKVFNIEEIKNKEKNEIFYKILKNPRELLDTSNYKMQNKARFMKEIMENVDPVGVDKDWWEELIKYKTVVPEDVMDNFF